MISKSQNLCRSLLPNNLETWLTGDASASGNRLTTRCGAKTWDDVQTHRELARLILLRGRFRFRRTLRRICSPRRAVATALSATFLLLYLLNGVFILSAREPADPARLRLWLSGGMVLYAIYHWLRCAWGSNREELDMTSAEELWLGGAPVRRSSLAVYQVESILFPAALKTLLLSVVLACDVAHLELLIVGTFTSLVLLEIVRLSVGHWTAALEPRERSRLRLATTLVAAAVGIQVVARVLSMTPMGSGTLSYVLNGFRCLGQTAASDAIQWMSIPWTAAAHLAVTDHYQPLTALQLFGAASVLPLAILLLVRIDHWGAQRRHRIEQRRLTAGEYHRSTEDIASCTSRNEGLPSLLQRTVPDHASDLAAVIARQWVSVRRYRATIFFSFVVPTLMCVAPLATGQTSQQWLFLLGGIALCTMLLAPPALRIDFRRDLKRMLLLRGLPVKPTSMVLGQLALPVVITWVYQWVTIGIGAIVTQPGLSQVVLWTGMLNALAVFTFGLENALFLAYPHHERAEGMAMMIRAKLTFLGKGTLIAFSLGLLLGWATICRNLLPSSMVTPAFIVGALITTWSAATAAIYAATICWRRFDLAYDTPPE